MNIAFDGNLTEPAIELSATAAEFRCVGQQIASLQTNTEIRSAGRVDKFYPESLERLICEKVSDPGLQGLLGVSIEDRSLVCRGGIEAFRKLGLSLLNFFSEPISEGEHLHIDYFEGNQLLAPTRCQIVFLCVGEDDVADSLPKRNAGQQTGSERGTGPVNPNR